MKAKLQIHFSRSVLFICVAAMSVSLGVPLASLAQGQRPYLHVDPRIEQAKSEMFSLFHRQKKSSTSQLAPKRDLKVATFNVGLLCGDVGKVPECEARRTLLQNSLGQFLQTKAPDVLNLQELWEIEDRRTVQMIAAAHGYVSASKLCHARKAKTNRLTLENTASTLTQQNNDILKTGLETLVRNKKFQLSKMSCEFSRFETQYQLQVYPGYFAIEMHTLVRNLLGYERGMLILQIKDPEMKWNLAVINTHLSPNLGGPVFDQSNSRLAQIEELHKQKLRFFNWNYDVILAADLNTSPEYRFADYWTYIHHPQKATIDRSAENYPVLLNGDKAENPTKNQLDTSFFDASAIAAHRLPEVPVQFTMATSINRISQGSPTCKDQPDQRIDFVLFRPGPERRYNVLSSEIVFHEKQAVPDNRAQKYLEVSDHYGLFVTFDIEG